MVDWKAIARQLANALIELQESLGPERSPALLAFDRALDADAGPKMSGDADMPDTETRIRALERLVADLITGQISPAALTTWRTKHEARHLSDEHELRTMIEALHDDLYTGLHDQLYEELRAHILDHEALHEALSAQVRDHDEILLADETTLRQVKRMVDDVRALLPPASMAPTAKLDTENRKIGK